MTEELSMDYSLKMFRGGAGPQTGVLERNGMDTLEISSCLHIKMWIPVLEQSCTREGDNMVMQFEVRVCLMT